MYKITIILYMCARCFSFFFGIAPCTSEKFSCAARSVGYTLFIKYASHSFHRHRHGEYFCDSSRIGPVNLAIKYLNLILSSCTCASTTHGRMSRKFPRPYDDKFFFCIFKRAEDDMPPTSNTIRGTGECD